MKSLQLFESGIEQRGTRVVKRSNISFKTVEINYGTYKISERIHSKIGENCYLADNATIIGDVVIGKDCSIWFNAVLRGDVNAIRIGNRVNIQDGSVVHTLYQKSVVEIGNDVSVGHNVTIHGATIKDGALIGMGSTILDHAVVGEGAIVAAGALVLSNTIIEPGSLWAGVPAKFIKKIPEAQSKELNQKIANGYLMYASWFKEEEK